MLRSFKVWRGRPAVVSATILTINPLLDHKLDESVKKTRACVRLILPSPGNSCLKFRSQFPLVEAVKLVEIHAKILHLALHLFILETDLDDLSMMVAGVTDDTLKHFTI